MNPRLPHPSHPRTAGYDYSTSYKPRTTSPTTIPPSGAYAYIPDCPRRAQPNENMLLGDYCFSAGWWDWARMNKGYLTKSTKSYDTKQKAPPPSLPPGYDTSEKAYGMDSIMPHQTSQQIPSILSHRSPSTHSSNPIQSNPIQSNPSINQKRSWDFIQDQDYIQVTIYLSMLCYAITRLVPVILYPYQFYLGTVTVNRTKPNRQSGDVYL